MHHLIPRIITAQFLQRASCLENLVNKGPSGPELNCHFVDKFLYLCVCFKLLKEELKFVVSSVKNLKINEMSFSLDYG